MDNQSLYGLDIQISVSKNKINASISLPTTNKEEAKAFIAKIIDACMIPAKKSYEQIAKELDFPEAPEPNMVKENFRGL